MWVGGCTDTQRNIHPLFFSTSLLLQEVCSQYWPNADEAATYGEFTVIASSVKEGTLTQRSFGVVHHSQVLCMWSIMVWYPVSGPLAVGVIYVYVA